MGRRRNRDGARNGTSLPYFTAARSSKGKCCLQLGVIAAAGFALICCTRAISARLASYPTSKLWLWPAATAHPHNIQTTIMTIDLKGCTKGCFPAPNPGRAHVQQWVKKKKTALQFRSVSQQAGKKNSVSRSRHNPESGELTITSGSCPGIATETAIHHHLQAELVQHSLERVLHSTDSRGYQPKTPSVAQAEAQA